MLLCPNCENECAVLIDTKCEVYDDTHCNTWLNIEQKYECPECGEVWIEHYSGLANDEWIETGVKENE